VTASPGQWPIEDGFLEIERELIPLESFSDFEIEQCLIQRLFGLSTACFRASRQSGARIDLGGIALPCRSSPQQTTSPSVRMAQVCRLPLATWE
jgi:hypothetical protein